MMSPSRTAAMGPPTNASGATWPAVKPRVAPREAAVGEQRDGVAELGMAADGRGHLQHLAHAGAALRAFIANHEHVAGLDLVPIARRRSSLPRNRRRAPGRDVRTRSAAAIFITQPSGARLPLRMTRPPVGLMGLSNVWITTWPGVSCGQRGFFGERLAADGQRRSIGVARIDEPLGQQARTARRLEVRMPCTCRPAPGHR